MVNSVAVFPDGQRVVSGGLDKKVKIADAKTGKILVEYAHSGWVNSAASFPDEQRVVSGGNDGKVKIADAKTGKVLVEYAHAGYVNSVVPFLDGQRYVLSVAPFLEHLLSGGNDHKVKIVDAKTGDVLAEHAHDYCVNSVAPFSNGQRVVSGGLDKKVRIADADTGEVLVEYAHAGYVRSVAPFPDGQRVVSGGDDGNVKIKSIVPLLLAQHQLKNPTLSQLFLLNRLQEKLLKDKEPFLIGLSDRVTLEQMLDLKKLLKVEKSKSKTKNPIWRLQLKGPADFVPQDADASEQDARGSEKSARERTSGLRDRCSVM